MIRPLLFAILAHVVVISFMWVGFPVPMPRAQAEFAYSGSLPAEDISDDMGVAPTVKQTPVDAAVINDPGAGFFGPWLQMRDVNKPKR